MSSRESTAEICLFSEVTEKAAPANDFELLKLDLDPLTVFPDAPKPGF